jgi:hypothetical protein
MRRIAAAVDVSLATLQYYFGNIGCSVGTVTSRTAPERQSTITSNTSQRHRS